MTGGIQAASGYAVAIGINQYEHFQPLHYAVRDAQAVQAFLKETQLIDRPKPSDRTRVVLLSDASPMTPQSNTYPTRANIQTALGYIVRQPQANDCLWVFFSGYGVEVNGQDYLMPIDGDPARAEATGIAIAQVFSILQTAATPNILLLLDINRSQSATANAKVGEQTAAIAAQTGISTILSCQPDQFAHETLALRHGLFTAALLEGLRYGNCTTIDHLVEFLTPRLAELSEHHWRPRQEPLAIVSAQQRYQLLWPRSQSANLDATPDNGKAPIPVAAAVENGHSAATAPPEPTLPIAIATGLPDRPTEPGQTGSTAVVPVSPPTPPALEDEDSHFQRSLLLLGGLLFALLCLGVLFQNRTEFTEAPTAVSPTPNVSPTPPPPTTTASPAPTPTPEAVSPSPAPQPIDRTVAPPAPATSSPAAIVAPAPTASSTLEEIRAALDRSIAAAPNTQISAFNQAIQQARRIPTTDPTYAQAQQDIDRWSALILNVAEQRANQSNGGSRRRAVQNYRSAIAAARLVPRDRPALYARAQRLIAAWNRRI